MRSIIRKSIRQIQGLAMKIRVPNEIEVHLRKTSSQTGCEKAFFVVVYNDARTFTNCFASSPFIKIEKTIALNNIHNVGVPTFFNQTIKQHKAENTWFIFCHQDFIFKEDLLSRLKELEPNTIYGPIGARKGENTFFGQILQTNNKTKGKFLTKPTPVQTLDEMCIIVHSSVFREGLEFDEKFKFHFYGADLCMSAYISGFDVQTLQFACQHKSRTLTGDLSSTGYIEASKQFRKKWAEYLPIKTTTALIKRE